MRRSWVLIVVLFVLWGCGKAEETMPTISESLSSTTGAPTQSSLPTNEDEPTEVSLPPQGECVYETAGMCWEWTPDAEEHNCGLKIDVALSQGENLFTFEHCWEHKVYSPYIPAEGTTNSSEPVDQETRDSAQRLVDSGWNSTQDSPATYFVTTDLSSDSLEIVKDGIQAAENYLGSYGPLRVYVIGSDTNATDEAIEDYCAWSYNQDQLEHCRSDQGVAIFEMAYYEGSNAFAQHSRGRHSPTQAFVIGNPLGIGGGYGSKISLHEYVHIYQGAHQLFEGADRFGLDWPIWMEEGGAEFLAVYLGDGQGWVSFEGAMEEALVTARHLRDLVPNLTIADLAENRDRVGDYCGLCIGAMQYETGQWAVALLASKTSIDAVYLEFYPLAYEHGVDTAFFLTFGLTLDEFLVEFESFMEQPFDEQIAILSTIS